MFGNPLTNQELLTLAQASAEQKLTGLNLPEKYILATPVSGYGFPAYRLFDAAYISTGIIDPNRLGTGSTGAGNKYLADDGTWKVISVGGGGDMLKATYDVDNDGTVDSAERIEIIVRNSTGSPLLKGQVVYLSGATGNRPNAVLSQANSEATSSKTMGIVVANINNNSDGYVAVNGTLHDLDTSAFADGAAVWLSPTVAGGLTTTVPSEPNHSVFIGYIARSHPTQGRLVLHIQNGYELNELHDVYVPSPTNGDLLQWDSANSYWKNVPVATVVPTPTLAQVTTAGNTTTNAITVGNITSAPSGANGLIRANGVNTGAAFFYNSQDASGDRATISVNAYYPGFGGWVLINNTIPSWLFQLRTSEDDFVIYRANAGTSSFNALFRIANTGNVLINTTTDAGYKLDVNGTARVQSTLTAGQNTGTSYNHIFDAGLGGITFRRYDSYATSNFITITQPNYGTAVNGSMVYITSPSNTKASGYAHLKLEGPYNGGGSTYLKVGNGSINNASHVSLAKFHTENLQYIGPTYGGSGTYMGIDLRVEGQTADYSVSTSTNFVGIYVQSNFLNRYASTTLPIGSWKTFVDNSTLNYSATPFTSIDITPTFTNSDNTVTSYGININPTLNTYTNFVALNIQKGKIVSTSSITATSSLAQGVYFNNTLVAAANNDVLVGLDINPTFTTGAFTGVKNYALRVNAVGYRDTAVVTINNNNSTDGQPGLYYPSGMALLMPNLTTNRFMSGLIFGTALSGRNSAKLDFYSSSSGSNLNYGSFGLYQVDNIIVFNGNGNVIIGGTTDSGYKLDVNGNTAVRGILYVTDTVGTLRAALQSYDNNEIQLSASRWVSGNSTATLDGNGLGLNTNATNKGNIIGTLGVTIGNSNFSMQPGRFGFTGQLYGTSSGLGGGETWAIRANVDVNITDGTTSAGTVFGVLIQPTLGTLNNVVYVALKSTVGNVQLNTTSGNTLIGTSTDAGYKLDVNGTTRVSSLYINSIAGIDILGLGGIARLGFPSSAIVLGAAFSTARLFIHDASSITITTATSFSAVASSLLTIDSTTRGFLQPRMTNAQAVAISTPATGLQVYDTTNNKNLLYDGTAWRNIATEAWVSAQGYLTSFTETDTLQSVTNRGAVTTNAITVNTLYIGKGGGGEETNTAVGYNALVSNTIPYYGAGFRNAAFGYNALTANTTGSYNTAVGRSAGESNTTGSNNTYIGEGAGQQNIVGNSNIYIGNTSGGNQTTSQNTYVGSGAGYSAAVGTGYSTYIGYLAGHATTGGDNVFLGHRAGFGSTKSDWFIIGNRNRASLIEGNFSTGNVLIGSSTDNGTNKLQVNGSISATGGTSTNWNTAFSWGNHASAGYLTSFTETDPTVPSHVKSITTTNVSNWNTAYSWGNHATAGYLTSVSDIWVNTTGDTMTGQLVISTTGTAGNPTLRVNTSTSSAYVHSQENIAANLTSGQRNILVVGQDTSTKNSGYFGYYWAGAGSDSNFITMGHWGNNDLFRIYGNGNANFQGYLSVGASNPSTNFEVIGSDAEVIVHFPGSSRGGLRAMGSQLVGFMTTASSDDLVFGWENGYKGAFTERMRIDNGTGNVLINTTTDSGYRLDVSGTFRATGNTILSTAAGSGTVIGTTTPLAKLHVQGGDALLLLQGDGASGLYFPTQYIRGGYPRLVFQSEDGALTFGGLDTTQNTSGNPWGNLAISSRTALLFFIQSYSGSSPVFSFDGSNTYVANQLNVATNLVVTGNVTVDTNTFFINATTNRVGIGTTSPSVLLQAGAKVIDDNNYAYTSGAGMFINQTATSASVLNDPQEVLILARQGTAGQAFGAAAVFELSRFENSGTASRTRLDIKLADGSFLSSSARVMTMLSNGNVGVGVTSPTARLHVAGAIRVTDTYPNINLRGSYPNINFQSDDGSMTFGSITTVQAYGTNPYGNLVIQSRTGLYVYIDSFSTSTPALSFLGGNLQVGLNVDAGYKFDVNGSFRSNGDTYVTSANGRVFGYDGLTAGQTIHFQYGGDSNHRISTTYGSAAQMDVYHGLIIRTSTASGGKALIVNQRNSAHFIQEWQENGTQKAYINSQGNLYLAQLDAGADGPVLSSNGLLSSIAGYTGTVTIQQPAPLPNINIQVDNGIITNVF